MIHTRKISISKVQMGCRKKLKSLKLSKYFNQKIKPIMYNSIFNNQEAKLNIHQVKTKKTQGELKKIVNILNQKLDWSFTSNKTQIKKTEKHSLNSFNFN